MEERTLVSFDYAVKYLLRDKALHKRFFNTFLAFYIKIYYFL